ncbi:MAG: hypothetical protein SGPRY_007869 [Prymnesium sp.]
MSHCTILTPRTPPFRVAEASEEAEGREVEVDTTWKVGRMSDGSRFLWRANPQDEGDPEVWLWKESRLESGEPFWFDSDGEISLTDPFDPDWEGPWEES